MHHKETEAPIFLVQHKYRTKKGEREVTIPVFGINYIDDTRYPRGKLKPGMRAVPEHPTDRDIFHVAAAIDKRERRERRIKVTL